MLAQRLRRWPNINPATAERFWSDLQLDWSLMIHNDLYH